MSSIVTTAEYNRFYIIVYVFSQYIFVYIQLDTLNINLYIDSELSIVYTYARYSIPWGVHYSLVNNVCGVQYSL